MKVVFMSITLLGEAIGGLENHIYYVSKYLNRKGVDISIVTPIISDENKVEDIQYDHLHIRKVYLKSNLNFLFKQMEKFHGSGLGMGFAFLNKIKFNLYRKYIEKEILNLNPDLIHQHDYLSSILLTKKFAKKLPVVFTNHTGEYLYFEKFGFSRLLQKKLISHFKKIIAPSRELLPQNNKSTYIPNGVDFESFYKFEINKINQLKTDEGLAQKIVFLCPRRWAPTKGILYLAYAIRALPKDILSKTAFLFAGSDFAGYSEYSGEVNSILNEVKDADIRLLGNLNQQELLKYYNIADIVVIPSLMEATSLSALEAMACAKPILSTDVGGMPEIIENNKTGWLIPSKDSNAIISKIKDIYSGKYNLEEMGNNAEKFVNFGYNWDIIADKTLEIYNLSLDKPIL